MRRVKAICEMCAAKARMRLAKLIPMPTEQFDIAMLQIKCNTGFEEIDEEVCNYTLELAVNQRIANEKS
jgi:hypothetical protein